MASSFSIKRFSARTEAMKAAAEDVYYRDLAPKGEKPIAKVKRVSKNVGRWVKHNPKTAVGIASGVALTGIAVKGGADGYKKAKAKAAEKTYSFTRKMFAAEGEQQKKGMGLGTKVLIGAGTLAAGLGAAKYGAFGGGAMKAVNKGLAQAGTTVGAMESKLGLKTGLGNKMLDSGVKGYGQGAVKQMTSGLAKSGKTPTDAMKTNAAATAEGRLLNKLVS